MTVHAASTAELVQIVAAEMQKKSRVVVAVAGVPGAGKSTIVNTLCDELARTGVCAVLLPQDGFHYYRRELAGFDDPAEAFRRRGAPFTFNADAFVATVRRLRLGAAVLAPLFDHSKKDPVEDDIVIGADVRVVFVEGNYVGLAEEPWAQLAAVVDQLWMLRCDKDVVRGRLIQRHLDSGVCATVEEATERCDGLDWANAVYMMEHSRPADVEIAMP